MLLRISTIHCFAVVDLGNCEILTICHIPCIFRTCNLDRSGTTFELPTLTVMCEYNLLPRP